MWKVVIICVVLDNIIMTSESSSKRKEDMSTPGPRLSLMTSMPHADKPVSRIVGGQPAPIEKYPYAVQVTLHGFVVCGGILITQKHVLTAAHCGFQNDTLTNSNLFTIRVGSALPLSGGTVYNIKEFNYHSSYNKPKRDNDIGIFVIDNTVALTDTVALATLAPAGYGPKDNSTVTYIGWGKLGEELPQPKTLLEVQVKVVNWDDCEDRYYEMEYVLRLPYPVTENMFCAGLLDVGGKDACRGDSGGPVIEGGVVVGIISWGLECGDVDFPAVNVKVSRYLDWIDRTMKKKSEMEEYDYESNSVMLYSITNTIIFCVCIAFFINNLLSSCLCDFFESGRVLNL